MAATARLRAVNVPPPKPAPPANPMGVRAEWARVTPALAADWLTVNHRNRPMNANLVARLVRDLKAGHWETDGAPIRFDDQGTLLDGQHRLTAIVESGVAVQALIIRGLDPKSQAVMDTGRARSGGNALAMAGYTEATNLAALIKLALSHRADWQLTYTARDSTPTHGELLAFAQQHPDAQESARAGKAAYRKVDARCSVIGYTHWAMTQVSGVEAADAFWHAVTDGVGLAADDPRLALSKALAVHRRAGRHLSVQTQLGMVFRCWNQWRKGKGLKVVKINSVNGGQLPIPRLVP